MSAPRGRPKRKGPDGGRGAVDRVGHRDGARTMGEVGLLSRLGWSGTSEDDPRTVADVKRLGLTGYQHVDPKDIVHGARPTMAEARALWLKFGATMLAEYTAERCRSLGAAAAISMFHEDAAVRRGAARWLEWGRARYRIDPRGLTEAEHVAALADHDAIEPPRPSFLPPLDVGTPDPNVTAWERMTPVEKHRHAARGGKEKQR